MNNVKDCFIFVGYRDGQIKIIWPAVKVKKFGVNFLGSPGGKYLDKNSLLFIDNDIEIIGALINKILENVNIYLAEIDGEIKNDIIGVSITKIVRQVSIRH